MIELFLLAQGTAETAVQTVSDHSDLLRGVLNLTGTGFAVWYGYHITTRTIPQIIKEGNDANQLALKTYREEMASERQFHERQIDKVVGQMEKTCRHGA